MKKVVICLIVCLLLIIGGVSHAENNEQFLEDYEKWISEPRTNALDDDTINKMWDIFFKNIEKKYDSEVKINYDGYEVDKPAPTLDTLISNTPGYVDGNGMVAKVDTHYAVSGDGSDNVWFVAASGKSIRKLNVTTNEINTFLVLDSRFNISMTENGKKKMYSYKEAAMNNIVYNENDGNMYVTVNYRFQGKPEGFTAVYRITPTLKMISYENSKTTFPPSSYWMDFLKFDEYNDLWFSTRDSYNSDLSFLNYAEIGDGNKAVKASVVGKADWRNANNNTFVTLTNGHDEAVITDESVYILTALESKLIKIDKYPRKMEVIQEFGQSFFAMTTRYNRFYGISNNVLYEIEYDGSTTLIADLDSLVYNSGSKLGIISSITFDSKGNLIVFDSYKDRNGKTTDTFIRRINL